MPRYVAFLRGVSPVNAKMPELKRCFEQAGFRNVRTVLTSGNVVFDAGAEGEKKIEKKIQTAMESSLDRTFSILLRKTDHLNDLLRTNPYAPFKVPKRAKRVITFLRTEREPKMSLPLRAGGAEILRKVGREVFTAYVPGPKGPVFMTLVEKAFGTDVTTRTWETVAKCAAA